ncbi:ABC transporter substrate-binding protein [Virgibacillus xinjiangensis]|uniref:ABC transporter substrate-binding protein n=1 Tax=Virgibacillus xinjiangensis TaxID=393090 RepID=A0ABV7CUK7_9BACI
MKRLITYLIIVSIIAILSACGGAEESDETENQQDSTEERTVTIEDARGEQTIEGTPENIVVLEWSYAEHLLSLGVQPAGVADLDGFHQWVNIDESFDESVQDVGTRQEPNLEAIARLDPDLIIAVDFRHGQYMDSLEEIAPVVTFAPYGEEAVQDHYQNMIDEFQTVAEIVNKEDEAAQEIERLENFISEQKGRVEEAGLAGSDYIVTQAFSAQNTPTLRLFTENSIVAQVMSKLGFENAYEAEEVEPYGYSEVTVEALQNFQEEDLQFLYIVQEEDNIFENQLAGNPVWENLTFVQEGNTHALPGDTWTFGGILSTEVLTEQLVDAMVSE